MSGEQLNGASHQQGSTDPASQPTLSVDILYYLADGFLSQRDTASLAQTSRVMAESLSTALYKKDILAVKDQDKASGIQHHDDRVYQVAQSNYDGQDSPLAQKHRELPRHFGKRPPALHWACIIGSLPMAKQIIQQALGLYKHYIDCKNRYSDTPLFLAVENDSIEIVRVLIEAGCYIDAPVETRVYIDDYMDIYTLALGSSFAIASPVWRQGERDDLQETTALAFSIVRRQPAISELLAKNTRRPYIPYKRGLVSILDLASLQGMIEVVRILVERDMIPTSDHTGRHHRCGQPLHFAAVPANNVEVMKLLVESGATHEAEDMGGLAPLDWAIINNRKANALYLLQLEDADYIGKRIIKGLRVSSKRDRSLPITQVLVDRLVAADAIVEIERALHRCMLQQRLATLTVQYLLHMLAVGIPKTHWRGSQMYLHWALTREEHDEEVDQDVVELFIEACAWLVDLNMKDYKGNTPLYYAKTLGFKHIAKLIKKHGGRGN
ncbi:ankyrin repeat-containing domain protein [Biscogniauxia mediterranea]|nr:ankyrin repeat-containing domain protein [Biscogniauxia mediterranea]